MKRLQTPRWQLAVDLSDGPERTITLDFEDRDALQEQLDTFEEQRRSKTWGRKLGQLYEFRNEAGDVIAFLDECFIRYAIIELTERAGTASAPA